MESLFVLVPVSILLMCVAAAGFIWAVGGKQFDELDARALDILDIPDDHSANPVHESNLKPKRRD